ncbi:MAG: tRNA pseudouridine(38-40) synthase TruA [Candidatus Krumholzibacteria bacterium]|nr:tRNA pseudouridine(38-40) synthase TruA [Candidatus Krumholzibacteria bacterium]
MRNFKLTIEYDGTDFYGWQIQLDRMTVQGELYRAFRELSGGELKIIGAGRTDAGVHAVGQVANVRLETDLSPTVVERAVNAKLPSSIFVRSVEEAHPSFNARFDARSRTYHYIFIRRPTALWRRYFHLAAGELDLRAIRSALRMIIGDNDFSSFASSADANPSKRCKVIEAGLTDSPPLVVIAVTADHFLHNMVRALAGTLLEIGRGKPLDMGEVIEACDRSAAGPTLPPNALYLMEVRY